MIYREYTLGDICLLGDGAHTKVKRLQLGIPYLTSKNIKNGYLDLDKVDFISKGDFNKLFGPSQKSVRHLQTGDLLMGIIGTLGNCYLYKKGDNFGISSSVAIIRPNQEVLLPQYLYYFATSKTFSAYIDMFKGGSVQGYTNLPTLRKIPVSLPSLKVQKSIVNILSSLDEKIETNNQIFKKLEEITQTIFKHWFVDFEFPNENGDPYKSSGGEIVVDINLGNKPKEWKVKNLNEIVEIKYGKNLPTKKLTNSGYPVFGGNGEIGYFTEYIYEKPQVLISCRGAASGTVLTSLPCSFVTNNSLILENNKEIITFEYLSQYCFLNQFHNYATGSAQPQITIANLNTALILVPNKSIVERFSKIINVINAKLLIITKENSKLRNIRDTLLPRLMSGEIRVPIES